MNYNQNFNNERHAEHPVRNVLFSICCALATIAFNYLWVYRLFEFEYTWLTIFIAVMILISSLIGVVISFTNSPSRYFKSRNKSRKGNAYSKNNKHFKKTVVYHNDFEKSCSYKQTYSSSKNSM